MCKLIIDIGSNSIRFLISEQNEILNKGRIYLNLSNLILNNVNKKHIIKHITLIIDDIIKSNFSYGLKQKVIYGTEILRQLDSETLIGLQKEIEFKYNTKLLVLTTSEQSEYIKNAVYRNFVDLKNINVIDITSCNLSIINSYNHETTYYNFPIGYNDLTQLSFAKYDIEDLLNTYKFGSSYSVLFGSAVEAFSHIGVVDIQNNLPALNFKKVQEFLRSEESKKLNNNRKTLLFNSVCILDYLFNPLVSNNINIYLCREDLRYCFV